MDSAVKNIRKWAVRVIHFATNKRPISSKSKLQSPTEASILHLPIEIIEQIFRHLSEKDMLLCRQTNSTLSWIVDQYCLEKITFIFDDDIYGKNLSCKQDFLLKQLEGRRLVTSRLKVTFIRQCFSHVHSLSLTDGISGENFQRLITGMPTIQTLTLNSLTLGGYQLSQNLHNSSSKRTVQSYPLNLKSIHIVLPYFQESHKGFSTQTLVSNLLGLHDWKTPSLQTISFEVQPATFYEQFYFSLDFFLLSMPASSYNSLQSLTIKSPKIKPAISKISQLHDLGQLKIQLHRVQINTPKSRINSLSPNFLMLLWNQKNLKAFSIELKGPVSDIINGVKTRNPNVEILFNC